MPTPTPNVTLDNEHYRTLFNNSSDAIFVLESNDPARANFVIDVNDVACQRLGYTREELIGINVVSINAPGYPKNMADIGKSIRDTGRALFETIHVTKDGRHIPIETNLNIVKSGDRLITYAVARDISYRKKLEAEVQVNQRNALALLNATNDMSLLLDENFVILAANKAVSARFKLPLSELIGKVDTELMLPEIAFSRRKHIEESKEKRAPISYEDERNGLRSLVTVNPIIDANGEIHRFAIHAQDVTEQRQVEAIERILAVVTQKILEGVPINELLELICQKASEVFNLGVAWIGKKLDDGTVGIQAAGGSAQGYIDSLKTVSVRWDDTPLGRGPTGTAIRTGTQQVRHVDDARFFPWRKIATEQGLKSTLALPLILRGTIYGAFTLYSTIESKFDSPTFQTRVSLLASKICVALEMAMEHEQVKLLSTALTSARNAVMITNVGGEIQWINPAFTELSGYHASELLGHQPRILKSGRHNADYYRELWQTILAGKVWSADAHERRKDGSVYTVQQTITPIFADSGEITHFVAVHEDVTAKLEAQKRIEYMASHDKLTGLPNRSLFFDRLANLLNLAKRSQQELGLIFIDLDGFKQVNDTQGHHIGDLLLQAVAQRLSACIRESDTVARLGGDEFVIILNNVEGREGASRVAEKIIHEMSEPFLLEATQACIGASLGVAISRPDEGEDDLTRRADEAMYQAKRSGKHTYCFAGEPV